jgi:ADP-ribosylglycohydrolase
MSFTTAELQNRFRGAFLGMAVGDALGFPLRGVPPESLARLELGEDFAPRPRGRFAKGQFSDDTQLMLAAAESVVREGHADGKSFGAHLAWAFREGVLLQPPASVSESAERLARGVPWMASGAPLGVKDPSVLSRGLVVGLSSGQSAPRIARDAGALAIVTHKDPTCAAATAAYARAVSLALEPEPRTPSTFCDALADAAGTHDPSLAEELHHLPRALAWDVGRAVELLVRVGVPTRALDRGAGLPAHVVPVLLTAVFAALRIPHDFRASVALALRCGGELDVAAALTGGIVGAHLGAEAIPARLRRGVLYADVLAGTADRLLATVSASEAVALVRARV